MLEANDLLGSAYSPSGVPHGYARPPRVDSAPPFPRSRRRFRERPSAYETRPVTCVSRPGERAADANVTAYLVDQSRGPVSSCEPIWPGGTQSTEKASP